MNSRGTESPAKSRLIVDEIEDLLRQAVAHHQAGELEAAAGDYQTVLAALPNNADALHNLGILELQRSNLSLAIELVEAAIAADGKIAAHWQTYTELLIRAKRLEDAHLALKQARLLGVSDAILEKYESTLAAYRLELQTIPDDSKVDMMINAFNSGQYQYADQLAEQLIRECPQHDISWNIRGIVARGQGKFVGAEKCYREAIKYQPDKPEYFNNLGNVVTDLGRLQEAIGLYQKAITIRPTFVDAYVNMGHAFSALGDYKNARQALEAALKLKPDSAQVQNAIGTVLRKQGLLVEAEEYFRAAVRQAPAFADAHCNLAALLEISNREQEALTEYRTAIQYNAHLAEAYFGIGNILREQRKSTEAIPFFIKAIQINPHYVEAHNNLGITQEQLGLFDDSERSYRTAISLQPELAEVHNNLGKLLKEVERTKEAATEFEKAIDLKPTLIEAYLNLANTLYVQGNFEAADHTFRRGLNIAPDHPGCLEGIANILVTKGKFDQAQELLARAHMLEPSSMSILASLANTKKMTSADHVWLAKAKQLAGKDETESSVERITLLFAIGKFLDDIREYDSAFDYFKKANELKKRRYKRYDPSLQETITDTLIQTYSKSTVCARTAGASESALPLMIVGMPRSGTSLLEQILSSHPATYGAGELSYWNEAVTTYAQSSVGICLEPDVLADISKECLDLLRQKSMTAKRVTDKMPQNFSHLGLIHMCFPKAKILHTQRNPVDTCLSIYFQNFSPYHTYANDLDDLAHYYREYHRLMAHWRSVLPKDIFLDVPYEAVVEDQEGWSRKVFEFIGLEWDKRCLDFHKTERRVGTASNWQARQPIYSTSKERWRNYEKFVGPLLQLLDLFNRADQPLQ